MTYGEFMGKEHKCWQESRWTYLSLLLLLDDTLIMIRSVAALMVNVTPLDTKKNS